MAIALRQKAGRPGPGSGRRAARRQQVPFIPYPTPLFDQLGALAGAINMLVDISERKRAEVSLARHRDEQAALYQFTDSLFRAASLVTFATSALGRYPAGAWVASAPPSCCSMILA